MTRIAREQESYVSTQEPVPTRRLFLTAGSAAAALVATGAAAALSSPDAELIRLGHEFKAAWAVEVAGFRGEVSDDMATELVKPCSDLARRIEAIPAKTLQGLMVKADVVSWCHCADFDGFEETTDLRIAAGIIRDLLALAV